MPYSTMAYLFFPLGVEGGRHLSFKEKKMVLETSSKDLVSMKKWNQVFSQV